MNIFGIKSVIIIILLCIILYLLYFLIFPSPEYFDIVIVGSGLAGLTAALEAYRISQGTASILLLEKENRIGGNSQMATSGINLLQTPIQKENNISDSPELFINDTIKSGKNVSDFDLVSTLISHSREIYSFFSSLNIDLTQVGILGGHSVPRTHRPSNRPIGITLTSSLYKLLLHQTNINIRNNATLKSLIYDDTNNLVKGLSYIDTTDTPTVKIIHTNSVILATGGFAHDFFMEDSLLMEYAPHLINFPITNGLHAQGLGLKLARKIGAEVVGMDNIQVHPTGFVNLKDRFNKKKILAPELLRGVGGILVNDEGKRFCNELGYRDYVTKEILSNCKINQSSLLKQTEAFLILNEKGRKQYGKNIDFYINNSYLIEYPSFSSFAKEFNISEIELRKTIVEYNEFAALKLDRFNKTTFPSTFAFEDIIYAGLITPSIHYTMGGLKITTNAEVVDKSNSVIKGLYAAGEVTGGVHGANRLGGNSLLECAVFGRRAARSALENIK